MTTQTPTPDAAPQTVFVRDAADAEAQEARSVTVRMARHTFSTEHGGTLRVNDLVDVAPSTARRWLRLGIAKSGDSEPIHQVDTNAQSPEQLRAHIAALQAQLAQTEQLGSGTPPNPFATEGTPQPQAPFAGPTDGIEHNLTEGAGPLGDVTNAPADDDEEETPTPRSRRNAGRVR